MYSLFRGKRAQEDIEMTLIPAFALVIVFGVIFFGLVSFFEEIRNHTLFEKIFIKKDLALLLDTTYSLPGDLELNYPKDTFSFTYHFEEDQLEVYNEKDRAIRKERYPIINDRNISLKGTTLRPTYEEDELKEKVKLRIQKVGKKITITDSQLAPFTFNCPEIENSETVSGKQLFTSPLLAESNLNSPELIRSTSTPFISIITYSSSFDTDTNNLVAYVSSDSSRSKESERVACLILNEILTNQFLKDTIYKNSLQEITGANIVFTDRFEPINQNNIAVALKIGNQAIPDNSNLLKNEEAMLAISSSINKGIEQYDD